MPIRFAAFEVNPESGELCKHGIRIRLQDQPFKILLALLEKPGAVVTREELRQRVWGEGTFVEFDHGLNAAINRLREALGDSAENPRYVETMARRGYRFIAAVEGLPKPEAPAAIGRARRRLVWAGAAAGALGIVLWLVWDRFAAPPPPRVVRLTAFAGTEMQPSFSPDGMQVAFAWDGDKQDNFDIFIKMVGSATTRRLTTDPAIDEFPAWSPDGRQIAFASDRAKGGIYVVSPLGGSERKLADIATGSRPSWSPDGKFLAVAGSYDQYSLEPGNTAVLLVPVESGGEPHRLLAAQTGTWFTDPAFSPDGRRLAVNKCAQQAQASVCQLNTIELNAELRPQSEPRPVRQVNPPVVNSLHSWGGLAWKSKDSLVTAGSVPAGSLAAPEPWLWLTPLNGEPQRLELAGARATYPAVGEQGRRLAFTRNLSHFEVWRWEPGKEPATFLTSSLHDNGAQFSHDGQRIAFESRRGGDEVAVWTANRDGTGLSQITKGMNLYAGSPRWSPDDRWIAFDAWGEDGRWQIWVIEASGGPPRRITHGSNNNSAPTWSRDGRWVYFTSNRSSRQEIWRVPAQSGPAEQVTRNGGWIAFESSDGKTLYYTKSDSGAQGLFAMAAAGGAERQVLEQPVLVRGFAVFPDGIYYLTKRDQNNRPAGYFAGALGPGRNQSLRWNEIRFHEFAGGRNRTLAEIEGPVFGLSVSPDRKTFLYARLIAATDLMLIENFR